MRVARWAWPLVKAIRKICTLCAEAGTPNSGIRCPIKRIRRTFWAVGRKDRRQVRQRIDDWKTAAAARGEVRSAGEGRGQLSLSPATRVPWHGDFYGVTLPSEFSSPSESSAHSRLVARKRHRCDLHTQIRHGSRKCACYDAVLWGARIDITRTHELRIGVRRPARGVRIIVRASAPALLYSQLTAGAGRNCEILREIRRNVFWECALRKRL